jgi:uncharacterized protein DUF4350
MRVQTYNRWTAGIATGVFVIVSGLLAGLSTQSSTDSFQRRPSTFFTDPTGTRALFLVAKRFLPATEQWRRPVHFLPLPGAGKAPSTIVVSGPALPLSRAEATHLDRWLRAGGQLILFTANGWPLGHRMPSDEAGEDSASKESQTPETFLSRYAPELSWTKIEKLAIGHAAGSSIPAGEVVLGWRRSFAKTDGTKVIAAVNNAPLAVEIPVEQGRIVAVADPSMASNGSLRRSDNAVWLVTLAAAWRDGKVVFDEYHHGFGQKRGVAELTSAFLITPWGWVLLQVAAAGLLYIFAYRRRFGRIKEPITPKRTSPMELVEARAGVLQAAGAQGLATELIVQHLCTHLTKAHSKIVDTTNLGQQLENVVKSRGAACPAAALRALFAKVQNGERLSDKEFIELGRTAGEVTGTVLNSPRNIRGSQSEPTSR